MRSLHERSTPAYPLHLWRIQLCYLSLPVKAFTLMGAVVPILLLAWACIAQGAIARGHRLISREHQLIMGQRSESKHHIIMGHRQAVSTRLS